MSTDIEKMERITEDYRIRLGKLGFVMTVCVVAEPNGRDMHYFYSSDKRNAAPLASAAGTIAQLAESILSENVPPTSI